MGVNSLPKIVTRQRRDCDLNAGPSAPESSTLTTRLPLIYSQLLLLPQREISALSCMCEKLNAGMSDKYCTVCDVLQQLSEI